MGMPPDERLGSHVKRVEQELMALKHMVLKPSGLTVPQYQALYFLGESPGMSAAALARACLVTPQTMATTLGNLENKGLVERTAHPWHRNVLETRLTEKGRAALEEADASASAVERLLSETFTAGEREQLIALLGRFSDSLHAQAREIPGGCKVMTPFGRD
ncbi:MULTISPECIES: MarR family winged helix-turn-helix transcriptional regulator [Streptosporangium]|uniref:DNA-binding MarR family transcriptional regulator n=1 Tax=Streptosporangium brasiliense TaxID=47480 RepID=A0ABT9R491_9ACTN|nr:MarR family transcriptional regulator [Streptosporangium brasiliense]MDP9864056.1 DNA-binding MarR family transcriptional regulator [Streptosporangium brasiliense]